MNIQIGPGPEAVRAKLFAVAQSNPHVLRTQSKSLNQKWNSVYSRTYLLPRDYEEASDEHLREKINKTWREFIANDLPTIVEAFAGQDYEKKTG